MGGPTTVFVRTLPYSCTDAGLEEAFGEIGPVKECFIIADKKGAGGKSKGFGFVQFALAEDAAAAVAQSKSFKVDGRAVTIDVAKQKPSQRAGAGASDARPAAAAAADADAGDESDSDAPKTRFNPPPSEAGRGGVPSRRPPRGAPALPAHPALADEAASRTVALAGLRLAGEPAGVDADAAFAAAEALGSVEDIVSPAPPDVVNAAKLRHDGATRGVALVRFESAAAAQIAVEALHRRAPGVGKRKGRRIKAQFDEGGVEAVARANKRGVGGAGPESVNDAPLLWARALGGCEGAKPKNWRVIVRNLAFRATDAEIREACSEAGFVWDLTVPRDFHGKPKGFAFAAYCRKAHAEAAVKKVNGKTIAGRPVAVDLALSKRSYEEAKKEAANEKEGEEEEGGEDDDENGSEEGSSSGSEEESSGSEEESSSGSEESSSGSEESSSGSEEPSSGSDAAPAEPSEEAPSEKEEDADDMARRIMMRVMDNPDAATNPAAAAEKDLKPMFANRKEAREAARVKRAAEAEARREAKARAKEAKDQKPQRRSDSGSDSDSDDVAPPLPGARGGDKDARSRLSLASGASVFVRDVPTEASKQTLYERMRAFGPVRSCRLVIDKATGRSRGTAFVDFHDASGANAAIAASEREDQGGVKVAGRHVAIALAVSSDEASKLAARRAREEGGKRGGMRDRSTPRDNRNLYLAKEGQIHEEGPAARGVSKADVEKRRRAAAEQALKLKNPNFFISKTRLQVRNVPLDVDGKALKKIFIDAVKRRATRANPRVMHAKLLYDPTRPDAEGKPRSRGIGFVEFDDHEHALAALRSLNNNPETFTASRRPIVEFAVEDARAVRKLARRREGLDKAQRERDDAKGKSPKGGRRREGGEDAGNAGKRKRLESGKGTEPNRAKAGSDEKRARAASKPPGRDDANEALDRGPPKGKKETASERAARAKREMAEKKKRKRAEAPRAREREEASFEPKREKAREKRDAFDDVAERHLRAVANAAMPKRSDQDAAGKGKRLARWFDY